MKIYKNTNTLDKYLPQLDYTEDKALAEIILIGGKKFDIEEFPKLKGIFKTGVGTDNLPFTLAKEKGVKIELPSASTCNIIYEETAAFTCHLILKGLYIDAGNWNDWKKNDDRGMLQKKILLIVGTGNIGQRVANKMQALMQVNTFDAAKDDAEKLKDLLATADAVSLHIPLNHETENFFNHERLSWLKTGALLINTSRGPIVDEEALYQELLSNRIKAAFDVFWQEPYKGKLTELSENSFIKTPHVASTCQEFIEATSHDFLLFIDVLKK